MIEKGRQRQLSLFFTSEKIGDKNLGEIFSFAQKKDNSTLLHIRLESLFFVFPTFSTGLQFTLVIGWFCIYETILEIRC